MRLLILVFVFLSSAATFGQANPAGNNRATVAATQAQLSGKWAISKILNPRQVELPADKVAGSHFTFGADGKYTAMVMGVEEKGDWKFGPENKSIHLFVNGIKTVWNILAVSDTGLVMQKGVRGNTVTFTR